MILNMLTALVILGMVVAWWGVGIVVVRVVDMTNIWHVPHYNGFLRSYSPGLPEVLAWPFVLFIGILYVWAHLPVWRYIHTQLTKITEQLLEPNPWRRG
jgi:hypothetical protein